MSVDAGGYHTCGLRIDGLVECWGDNDDGESTPPPVIATADVEPVDGIAFSTDLDGDFEIYTTVGGGADVRRLTLDPSTDTDPSLSPDGRRIAFSSDRDGDYEIYVMNADGTGVTQLTNDSDTDIEPTWSPDGKHIAFVSDTQRGETAIHVMDADGTDLIRLTDQSSPSKNPSWSPDGERVAFSSERDDDSDIYVIETDGSGEIQLTDEIGADIDPSWSPDGDSIAFSSDRDGNLEIFLMGADGTNVARLTRFPGQEPVWSPDGSHIAFKSFLDGNSNIRVVSSDTSNSFWLNVDIARASKPSWSPVSMEIPASALGDPFSQSTEWGPGPANASGRIAFHSRRGGHYEIFTIDADGSDSTRLTKNVWSDANPSWSPDGTRIAFESDRDESSGVYTMTADGSEQTRLSDDVGSDRDPVWSPDGRFIAFVSLYRGGSGNPRRHQLRVINADGTEQNAWVSRHKDELGNPSWSPDGRRIVFEINDSGDNPEIAVVGAGSERNLTFVGAGPEHILTYLPEAEQPDWSPDGLRIVFHAVDELNRFSTPERTNIYLIDPEGKEAGRVASWHRNVGLIKLTDRSVSDWDPKWSPDGRRIVFSSSRDGDSEIYVMNADGSGIVQLTDNMAGDLDPIWSPDGRHIAFLSGRDSERGGEIYIMNADGSDQTRLTYNQRREYEITWSPVEPTETSDVDLPRFEMEWDVSTSELKADESFTLRVRMHGIQQPGEHGGISVSFPTLTSSGGLEHHHASAVADVEVVEYTTGTSNVKFHQSGATIYHREDNRQFSAEYLLVEADDATWSASADRTLVLRVTPKGEGDFPIQIRGWLCADEYESCQRDPVDGVNVDQQGYSVRHTSITVRSPQSTASTRIAFSSASGELYVINSDGTAMTRVAANGVYSTQGRRVAFKTLDFIREDVEKDRSGNDVVVQTRQYDINVMDADGSNSLRLTDSAGNDQYPSWSPDGTTIAFVSDRDHEDRTNDVYKINVDGSGLKRLTDHESRISRPRWSPDGKRVAFESRRQGEDSDVFVIGSDGSNLLRITDNPGDDGDPVWSPDGQRIAFESDRDGMTRYT